MRDRRSIRRRTAAATTALVMVASACSSALGAGGDAPNAAPAHSGCVSSHEDGDHRAPEHCAALALTEPADATHAAVASGPWSEASTWVSGVVPDEGSAVHVPEGMEVTVDTELAPAHRTVRIDGLLRFASDVDTELRVDTIVGSPGSTFEMGTTESPIAADVTAALVVADLGPIDLQKDPGQFGRGVVLHGKVRMAGADRTDWSELASAPVAGDDRIELPDAPQGWRPGDRLVVAGVAPDGTGEEEVTIASVDGAAATLDQPLAEDHVPPRADLRVHVANLTRNAVIRSESPDLDRRGHVMFMHTRDVEIANTAFIDLGRTDKSRQLADVLVDEYTPETCTAIGPVTNPRARYSVHFHRNGVIDDGDPATVTGSVVEGNPGWGYVNHSSNVDFTDNVAYDVTGAGFSTEVGDEVGSFVGNLAVKTQGNGSVPARAEQPTERRATQDFGFAGHGFWLQGPGVRVDDNVAAGATGAGIMVYAEALIEAGVGRAAFGDEQGGAAFPVVQTPLADMTGNTTYGSVTGLWMYYHRTFITLGAEEEQALRGNTPDLPVSLVEGLSAWSNLTGVRTNYTVDTEFRDTTIVGPDLESGPTDEDGRPVELTGFDATNVYSHGIQRYTDLDIEGYEVGLRPAPGGEVTIDGGRYANREVDIALTPARQVDRLVTIGGDIAFPGAEDDGRTTVAAESYLAPVVDSEEDWYRLNDRILLDPGAVPGGADGPQQLFYDVQPADAVPFGEQPSGEGLEEEGAPIPDRLIGLTNAELAAEGGAFAGAVASADAAEVPGIAGLVGSPTDAPEMVLDAGAILEKTLADIEAESDGEDVDEEEPDDGERDEDEPDVNGDSEGDDEDTGEALDEEDADDETEPAEGQDEPEFDDDSEGEGDDAAEEDSSEDEGNGEEDPEEDVEEDDPLQAGADGTCGQAGQDELTAIANDTYSDEEDDDIESEEDGEGESDEEDDEDVDSDEGEDGTRPEGDGEAEEDEPLEE